LSNKERSRIENHPLFRTEGIAMHSDAGNPNQHIENMLQKILVNDRVGLGDMRAKLLFNVANNCYMNAWLGIQATLPTAVDFKVGIFGSRFKTNSSAPSFELKSFVNLFLCDMLEKIVEMGTQFGFEALRRLSTILINIPLGNDKHLGIGPYFEAKSFIDPYWSMRTSLRFDQFLPKRHKRFFLAAKNPQDFDIDLTDEEQADQNLAFIDKQINNTVFPFPVCVDVFPGHVIQVNHAFLFDTPCWHIGVGLDFWYKSKEVLGLQTGNEIGAFPKNVFKASQPHTYQGKIFSEIGYHGITRYRNICWQALIAADVTVFSKDIGKDFTLGVRIGIDF
jgi:hypothetical protein